MIAIRPPATVFLGGPQVCNTIVLVGLVAAGVLRADVQSPSAIEQFVHRDGGQLLEDSREFRFISFNIPDLHQIEDHFCFDQKSVWRWPNEFEITDALESVRQVGGRVVRIDVLSVRSDDTPMGDHVHVQGPDQFNEEAFLALDKVLQIANQKGVRVIIPLVGNGTSRGGISSYTAFRQKAPEHFWTDPQIISDFKRTIRFVLERTNTLTGEAYRDDKAVFGWETGDALDAPPVWTREIAAYLKSLDSNHLVIAGNSRPALSDQSLDDPNVDMVTTRHNWVDNQNVVEEVQAAITAARGKKPYYISKLRGVDLPTMKTVLDAVIDEGASGALVWSLRFHHRDGGFYWHSEPASKRLLKAYHWPGFKSGEAYAERQVFDLIRQQAARIRDVEPSPLPVPLTPHLLPIANPGQIRWRGAVGATSYDVHRGHSADGPWELIGADISDAEAPYRPNFSDNRTELNKQYFYHIVAKNESGASPTSNVVGPVKVAFFEMVDEFKDNLLVRQQHGPVEWIQHDARQAQEDFHRLRMRAGGSVTYQVGEAMRRVTLLTFLNGDRSHNLAFATSPDGTNFAPLDLKREDFSPPHGADEYLRPVRYEGDIESPGVHFLRITLAEQTSDEATAAESHFFDLSRLEIDFGGNP